MGVCDAEFSSRTPPRLYGVSGWVKMQGRAGAVGTWCPLGELSRRDSSHSRKDQDFSCVGGS